MPNRLRAIIVLAALVMALGGGRAGARELTVADTHVPDYPTVQALQYMGRLLNERSGGRLSLKVLHSAQVGEEKETIRQAQVGAIDLIRVNLAPFNELVPETIVPSLPFLFRSVDHMRRVMDGPVGTDILKAFDRHGLVGLAFYDSGARSFYVRSRRIGQPADLAGLRIRVQQSPLFVAMIEALGAIPVPLPYGQVGVALGTGVIDGAENNIPSYHEADHYRSASFYALSEHSMAPEVLAISRRSWDGLSAADRALVQQAARDSVPEMRRLWDAREKMARDAVIAGGASLDDVDKRRFESVVRPIHDRFAGTPALKELVRRVQATE